MSRFPALAITLLFIGSATASESQLAAETVGAMESIGVSGPDDARAATPDEAQRILSIEDVLDLALQNNPRIIRARLGTEESQAEYDAATAEMHPRIEVTTSLAPVPGHRIGDPATPFAGTPDRDFGDLGEWGIWARLNIKLYQPIYTSGKITWLRRAHQLGVQVGKAREDIAKADVRLEVMQAYFGLMLTRKLASVLAEGRGYFDKARKHLQKMEDEDDPSFDPVDTMKVSVYEAQIIERELQAKRMMKLAEGQLRRLIDEDPLSETTFSLPEDLEPVEPVGSPSLNELVQTGLDNRVELAALRTGIKAREAEVEARFRNFFPDFLLYGEFNVSFSNVADNMPFPYYDPYNDLYLGAGLVMRFDLNIGKKLGQLKVARAKKSGLQAELDAAENGIALEISKLFMEMDDARTMMETRRNALKAARGWVIAKTDLFENDLCGLQDIIDGLTQFFLAQVSFQQSIYDFNMAVAALERATGVELVPVPGSDVEQ
ncbi:MAG TPA: TolC family protein [Myxococcota bacterium]|nr:TolC family protein [Myxococcota bacterium]HPV03577.1 TolC family protein [Myxococcota bacterium]